MSISLLPRTDWAKPSMQFKHSKTTKPATTLGANPVCERQLSDTLIDTQECRSSEDSPSTSDLGKELERGQFDNHNVLSVPDCSVHLQSRIDALECENSRLKVDVQELINDLLEVRSDRDRSNARTEHLERDLNDERIALEVARRHNENITRARSMASLRRQVQAYETARLQQMLDKLCPDYDRAQDEIEALRRKIAPTSRQFAGLADVAVSVCLAS